MKKRTINIPKGKDLIIVFVTGHSFLVLRDASGQECFLSNTKSNHHNVVVVPGRYTLETDGNLRKVSIVKLDSDLKVPKPADLRKPPKK